jgi:hypothetical protein
MTASGAATTRGAARLESSATNRLTSTSALAETARIGAVRRLQVNGYARNGCQVNRASAKIYRRSSLSPSRGTKQDVDTA